jgi:hypothetical protein
LDFLDYIKRAFLQGEPRPEVKRYFIRWYVSQYVRPGFKLKVAIAMYSLLRQVGKSELGKMLRVLLLGDGLVVECKSKDVMADFNGPLESILLLCLEEYARNSAYNNNLKLYLTSDVIMINKKGINQFSQPNCINWMIPTNHPDAIDVQDFDKRVITFLIQDGINTKLVEADGAIKDFALYKDRQWDPVHIAAGMLAWAESDEGRLNEWDPTVLPITEGSRLQRECGEEIHFPVAAWWRRVVEDDVLSAEVLWGAWNPTSLLHSLFLEDLNNDVKEAAKWTLKSFTQQFALQGYGKASRRRSPAIDAACEKHGVAFNETQIKVSAFELPDRATARSNIDRVMRAPIMGQEDEEA